MIEINWFMLVVELLGGLALFLFGMDKMSDGLKKSAGQSMRKILSKLTNNRFVGVIVGAFVTMVIQSSSATSVMLISFVQSGLMSFTNSMGVMLGANIGTTFTAQLVAFKLTDYALVFVFVGFGFLFAGRKEKLRNIGDTLLGFGLLFYGMKLMSMAMLPLREYTPFIDLLQHLQNPILAVLVAASFTALIQSSSAFTGIVIVLAQQNLIGIEAGIPLVIGSNIGTCFTAGLAAIGATNEAKRVAVAHTVFNLLGAVVFLFFIPQLVWCIRLLSEMGGDDVTRQIANAHTLFNIAVAVLFLPLLGVLDRLISKLLPLKTLRLNDLRVKFLDKSLIATPDLAIGLSRAEVARMVRSANHMYNTALLPFVGKADTGDPYYPHLNVVESWDFRENKLEFLGTQVAKYLVAINGEQLTTAQHREVMSLNTIVNYTEQISGIVHKHILPIYLANKEDAKVLSEQETEHLTRYHLKIAKQFQRLRDSLTNQNVLLASKVLRKGEKYQRTYIKYQELFFVDNEEHNFKNSNELNEALRQIEFYLESIATAILSTEEETTTTIQ